MGGERGMAVEGADEGVRVAGTAPVGAAFTGTPPEDRLRLTA